LGWTTPPIISEPKERAMAFFEWKPVYSVKNDFIDGQHKKLILFMNQFYEDHSLGKAAAASEDLKNLIAFTQRHFADEEMMMTKAGYPELDSHRDGHKHLLELVQKLVATYQAHSSKDNADRLSNFLKNWLAGHILGSDKKYQPYLTEAGIAA
jgi:hemerythrin